ncbi:MAG: PAS domain-containing protein [Bryobacteraceae bacterium]
MQLPRLNRSQALFGGVILLGAACLAIAVYSLLGSLRNPEQTWERKAILLVDTLAKELAGEAARGPRVTPGSGEADPWERGPTDWQAYEQKLNEIEAQFPKSAERGPESRKVRGLMWEARNHGLDLRVEKDASVQKGLEQKWVAAVSLAEANLRALGARLRRKPAEEALAKRSAITKDLGIVALGILVLAGAAVYRIALRPPPPARTAAVSGAPSAVGGEFSLVAYRFSRDAIVAADHSGNVCSMNAAAEKMLGAPATSYLGRPLTRIFDLPEREMLDPEPALAKHDSGATIEIEMIYRRLRGRNNKNASIAILRERTQELVPVGERGVAPAQQMSPFEADSTLLADLLEHCPAPLVILDPGGRLVHFNRALFETTGYNVADIQGMPYWEVALRGAEAERERTEWASGAAVRTSTLVEETWWTASGEIHFEWSRSVFRDAGGKPLLVVGIGAVIGERGRAAKQVIEAKSQG